MPSAALLGALSAGPKEQAALLLVSVRLEQKTLA